MKILVTICLALLPLTSCSYLMKSPEQRLWDRMNKLPKETRPDPDLTNWFFPPLWQPPKNPT